MGKRFAIFGAAILALSTVFGALAEPQKLPQFTQDELDTGWEADRQEPTGGYESITAFGRENVVRIGIDSAKTHSNPHYRTEGITTEGIGDFGDGIKADLYIDPAWQGKAMRTGLWAVGSDGEDGIDNYFAVLEFANLEDCQESECDPIGGRIQDHQGWRFWDPIAGAFTTHHLDFEWGEWYTLTIVLDANNQTYHYYVDDTEIGTAPAGQHYIAKVYLNSYNYGLDNFPTLSNEGYDVHWHAGLLMAVGEPTYPLCANHYTGQVVTVLRGSCPPLHTAIETPSVDPLTFCYNRYTGELRVMPRGCVGTFIAHVVPDDGDLHMCTNRYTSKTRYVRETQNCSTVEVRNVLPVGDIVLYQ